jgi:hypothetical protein
MNERVVAHRSDRTCDNSPSVMLNITKFTNTPQLIYATSSFTNESINDLIETLKSINT